MRGNIFANTTNPTMKPETRAWQDLQAHASAQLSGGFADRVLRATRGPQPEAWRQLRFAGAAALRPGFADRVLRVARAATEMPSLASQFALSAVTAVACLGAVLFMESRSLEQADARNLAEWQQIVSAVEDMDSLGL